MERPLNRIQPALPAAAYKTYAVAKPLATHFRDATCAEVDCSAYIHGWRTTVDESTDLGKAQAYHIRRRAGRRFAEHRDEAGLTSFDFEAGQTCFRQHKAPIGRPEIFLVGNGDHRMFSPRRAARLSARDWLDDFGEHQQRIADQIEKG